jgi:hypothetical protein
MDSFYRSYNDNARFAKIKSKRYCYADYFIFQMLISCFLTPTIRLQSALSGLAGKDIGPITATSKSPQKIKRKRSKSGDAQPEEQHSKADSDDADSERDKNHISDHNAKNSKKSKSTIQKLLSKVKNSSS